MPSYAITGASRGIGLEFVRNLSKEPTNIVFAIVRNKTNAEELVALKGTARNVHVLEADVTDFPALKAAADKVKNITGGKLDQLINNAAYFQAERASYTLDQYAESELDLLEGDMIDSFKTNVLGVVYTTNAFLPLLRNAASSGLAKVITLSSGMGDTDMVLSSNIPFSAAYAVSKAAVNMVVAKYAARFKGENLIFLAISPGLVNTAVRRPTPEELAGFQAMVKTFQIGYPDWEGLPLSPEESVRMMLSVVGKSELKDSGAFISHKGNKEWL